MRKLGNLGIGEKFRPALQPQPSKNGRSLSSEEIYKVVKHYPMSPYLAIVVKESNPEDGFYSLGPDVPTTSPSEPRPGVFEIAKFLGARVKRTRIVAYRLLWDGKLDLSKLLGRQELALVKLMYYCGKREYAVPELHAIVDGHFVDFLGYKPKVDPWHVFLARRRQLVRLGVLEELVDILPAHELLRGPNLEEELREC